MKKVIYFILSVSLTSCNFSKENEQVSEQPKITSFNQKIKLLQEQSLKENVKLEIIEHDTVNLYVKEKFNEFIQSRPDFTGSISILYKENNDSAFISYLNGIVVYFELYDSNRRLKSDTRNTYIALNPEVKMYDRGKVQVYFGGKPQGDCVLKYKITYDNSEYIDSIKATNQSIFNLKLPKMEESTESFVVGIKLFWYENADGNLTHVFKNMKKFKRKGN